MNPVIQFYNANQGICNLAMALLVFGGLGRIAFWHESEGMRIGGPLALGLGLMLSLALIVWADKHCRQIGELGPWAAFFIVHAMLILFFTSRRKSKRM